MTLDYHHIVFWIKHLDTVIESQTQFLLVQKNPPLKYFTLNDDCIKLIIETQNNLVVETICVEEWQCPR